MSTTEMESLTFFEAELAKSELHTKALRQVVEGLRLLNGHAPRLPVNGSAQLPLTEVAAPPAATVPRGIEAVLTIMGEKPGTWTRGRVMKEFGKRGWFHTADKHRAEGAVDAALYRLVKTGRVTKVKPGVYRLSEEAAT